LVLAGVTLLAVVLLPLAQPPLVKAAEVVVVANRKQKDVTVAL
jgi:hypothetical protein